MKEQLSRFVSRIRILHIFPDEKFFDGTANFFDEFKNLENHYLFYTKDKNYKFKYIKNLKRLKILNNKSEYYHILKSDKYDVVYLHSLSPKYYDYVLKINPNTIVIWWGWGYDIYYSWHKCKPLVEVDLYKPLTALVAQHSNKQSILKQLLFRIIQPFDSYKQNKVLNRIDYYSPVIPVEYDFLKKHKLFRAKPFMVRGPGMMNQTEFLHHTKAGNILIGNSLTLTNNHLDIFQSIKNFKINKDQRFIVPISYGNEINRELIINTFNRDDVYWMESFIPKEEYFSILSSASHAIFGIIRQQAMGNIYRCLHSGVKIYLYQDSVIYKYLKSSGYIVYTIEDINEESLQSPLDYDSALHNYRLEQKFKSKRLENINNEISLLARRCYE